MTGPVLETERLILRPIAMEDFPRWAEMMGDSEAAKFLGGVQPASVAWRGFMTMAGAWSLTGVSMFSIIGRETGLWLGRAGPWSPPGWPGTEVGWALHPDAQQRAPITLDDVMNSRTIASPLRLLDCCLISDGGAAVIVSAPAAAADLRNTLMDDQYLPDALMTCAPVRSMTWSPERTSWRTSN